jgi:hypothetical protein
MAAWIPNNAAATTPWVKPKPLLSFDRMRCKHGW